MYDARTFMKAAFASSYWLFFAASASLSFSRTVDPSAAGDSGSASSGSSSSGSSSAGPMSSIIFFIRQSNGLPNSNVV